jgi:Holliday junction DNA helicase RuvB
LKALNVDAMDWMKWIIKYSIIDKFKVGPVGLSTLATAVSETAETVEEGTSPSLFRRVL